MSFYKKLSRNKTVDITYVNPSVAALLDAFERQEAGKSICVLSGAKQKKRTPPLRKDALKTIKKISEITGQTVGVLANPHNTDLLCAAIKDILSLRGGVICEDCEPDETVPARHGMFLFCGDKMIYSSEVVFTEPTRSIRRPLC